MSVADLLSWFLFYQLDGMEALHSYSEAKTNLVYNFTNTPARVMARELTEYDEFPMPLSDVLVEKIEGVQRKLRTTLDLKI